MLSLVYVTMKQLEDLGVDEKIKLKGKQRNKIWRCGLDLTDAEYGLMAGFCF